MMILFILLIGFGMYYIFSNNGKSEFGVQIKRDPVEILKKRYVNGEIDEETYEKMLKTIKK